MCTVVFHINFPAKNINIFPEHSQESVKDTLHHCSSACLIYRENRLTLPEDYRRCLPIVFSSENEKKPKEIAVDAH